MILARDFSLSYIGTFMFQRYTNLHFSESNLNCKTKVNGVCLLLFSFWMRRQLDDERYMYMYFGCECTPLRYL